MTESKKDNAISVLKTITKDEHNNSEAQGEPNKEDENLE